MKVLSICILQLMDRILKTLTILALLCGCGWRHIGRCLILWISVGDVFLESLLVGCWSRISYCFWSRNLGWTFFRSAVLCRILRCYCWVLIFNNNLILAHLILIPITISINFNWCLINVVMILIHQHNVFHLNFTLWCWLIVVLVHDAGEHYITLHTLQLSFFLFKAVHKLIIILFTLTQVKLKVSNNCFLRSLCYTFDALSHWVI